MWIFASNVLKPESDSAFLAGTTDDETGETEGRRAPGSHAERVFARSSNLSNERRARHKNIAARSSVS